MQVSEQWAASDKRENIVDHDGWPRYSTAMVVFWHCVPISKDEYHNRRNVSSTTYHETEQEHHSVPWTEDDNKIWQEFAATRFGKLLIREKKVLVPEFLSSEKKLPTKKHKSEHNEGKEKSSN